MTLVSNDPSWWPLINVSIILQVLAASVGIELIWRQRWSLMTFLYLGVRYVGIGYAVVPTVSMTDAVSVSHRCLLFPSKQLDHAGLPYHKRHNGMDG
ncbi:hypothetical protein BDR03DRAFT_954575 [Suillus americanus]|nr:hypothetical protein BDR03DRAFT_954575 [Suillus americanus]